MTDKPTETALPKPGFGGGARILDRSLRRFRTDAAGAIAREPLEVRERCRKPNATPGDAN